MKISSLSLLLIGLLTSLLACKKQAGNSDGSLTTIADTMRTYLANNPVWSWQNYAPPEVLFQNTDALVIPEELEGETAEVHIRAFQNKFHRLIPSTWVVGYVSAHTKRGHEQLPGPTIEATNGNPTAVKWVNQLAETLQENKNYNFPYKGLKYYPIVYNTKTLEETLADLTNPVQSAAIPMITQALYPARIDEVHTQHQPTMFHSTYYSTTVHLHGANLAWHSDGYTGSSTVENAGDVPIPTTYGLFGPYEQNKNSFTSTYPNTFPEANYDTKDTTKGRHGAILWYHDHSIMRTTPNVYMGLAGAYIVEGLGESQSQQAFVEKDRSRASVKHDIDPIPDIPLIISDKMFTTHGDLYYESKFNADSTRQPEFFGNTIIVNGKAWPHFDVKRQLYRFRVLNTSSSRFYRLALARWKNGEIDTTPIDGRTCIQIGTEGGLFTDTTASRYITVKDPLMLAPGERADILLNFSDFSAATPESLVLLNLATGDPYQEKPENNVLLDTLKAAHKSYENFVMQFRIQPRATPNKLTNGEVVKRLNAWNRSAAFRNMVHNLEPFERGYRNKSFNDRMKLKGHLPSMQMRRIGPPQSLQSTLTDTSLPPEVSSQLDSPQHAVYPLSIIEAANFAELPSGVQSFYNQYPEMKRDTAFPMAFLNESEWNMEANVLSDTLHQQVIKRVKNRTSEVWKITNFTGDTHPIHIHLNRFRILGRTDKNGQNFMPPEPREQGWKDVVRVKPDTTITYLVITYVLSDDEQESVGQFVYHCHILEHEDVSMMRRLLVSKDGVSNVQASATHQSKSGLLDTRFNIPFCSTRPAIAAGPARKPAPFLFRTFPY